MIIARVTCFLIWLNPLLQGDTIVKRGDYGHEVLLINSGCVRIPRTRWMRRTIYLYEGDHFGEVATLFGERHSFSAIAHTHCRIYSLDQLLLEELCSDHPPCIEALVKSMEYYHQHMPDMTPLAELRSRLGLTAEGLPAPKSNTDSDRSAEN